MQNRINEGRSHGYTDRSIASELAVSVRLGRYERPWQPVTRTQPDKLVTNVLNENSPKGGGGDGRARWFLGHEFSQLCARGAVAMVFARRLGRGNRCENRRERLRFHECGRRRVQMPAGPRVARAFSLAMQPLDKNIEKGNKGHREKRGRKGRLSRHPGREVDQFLYTCARPQSMRDRLLCILYLVASDLHSHRDRFRRLEQQKRSEMPAFRFNGISQRGWCFRTICQKLYVICGFLRVLQRRILAA